MGPRYKPSLLTQTSHPSQNTPIALGREAPTSTPQNDAPLIPRSSYKIHLIEASQIPLLKQGEVEELQQLPLMQLD